MGETAAELSNAVLCCSLLGFAVISWLVWKFTLAPPARPTSSSATAGAGSSASRANANNSDAAPTTSSSTRSRRAAGTASSNTASSAASRSGASSKDDDDDDAFSFGQPRHPPHFVAPSSWSQKKSDLSDGLAHGIVPFRYIPAAGYEARLQREKLVKGSGDENETAAVDLVVVNRKERARVFARMFSAKKGAARPPNRGANVVVTIRYGDVDCSRLQKALYLLGTYYNLFVLIDGSGASDVGSNDEERREFINKLRSSLLNQGDEGSEDSKEYKLNADIVPRHRIAFSSTSRGRVAFVRQLHGTELVVDCEEDVTKELERFGFRVLLYPKTEDGTSSALGKFLVP